MTSTWGLWHAVYALVDARAKHNRERLLAAVAEQRDKHPRPGESASQQEVAPLGLGATNGTL